MFVFGDISLEGKKYYNYWGKAQDITHYHLLPYHCLDVAAMVSEIIKGQHNFLLQWSALKTKEGKSLSVEQLDFLCVFSFMLHDLGKFSQTFQGQIPELFSSLFPNKKIKNYEIRHDSLGYLFYNKYGKKEIFENNLIISRFLEQIIQSSFGHHGMPPLTSTNNMEGIDAYFCNDDKDAALTFIKDCFGILTIPAFPSDEKSYRQILKDISWSLAGVGTLADWIASDEENYIPIKEPISLKDYWNDYSLPNAKKTINKIGWNVCPAQSYKGIQNIFPFITKPTPLQDKAATLPLLKGSQLFIIEDVTGAGKTEAAIILASRIMSEKSADGIYVALPTMATANAMFSRLGNAYRTLYSKDSNPSLILAHGARHLSKEFEQMLNNYKKATSLAETTNEIVLPDEDLPTCGSWYADNKKKALLSDVGVGTIDQALTAILPIRHQSMRFVGLQRKILIVDEVHAYDSYMETLLKTLLFAHARNGGSAILLSATIPMKKREELMAAFYSGLTGREADFSSVVSSEFPLITQVNSEDIESYHVETRKTVSRTVKIEFINSKDGVVDFILSSANKEKCVCWIRNTVNDVRDSYQKLLEKGIDKNKILIFHSRYAMIDRARIEQNVLNLFGKKSTKKERQGMILIASQVVEQSLDLDFDELVSDIAPIDLLIQRAGRMHRHIRDENGNTINGEIDKRGDAVFHVFAPEFTETPTEDMFTNDFIGTQAVYRNVGKLWLTEKILATKGKWTMPDDARELIEFVYGDNSCEIPKTLLYMTEKAIGQERAAQGAGDLTVLDIEKGYKRNSVGIDLWDEEDKISTRLTEENKQVVLAVEKDGSLFPYASCNEYPWDLSTLSISEKQWKKTDYILPKKYESMVEELRGNNPRLKYSEIVIVDNDSTYAMNNIEISEIYSPILGWGKKELC